ncbi:MAG: HlyD family efflux transporter periplasmic adaptor subunit [Caulobacter sp.]|nr:HlyD family efflux transporter periplasmic adaptor subunit [Caulobacter sp.]
MNVRLRVAIAAVVIIAVAVGGWWIWGRGEGQDRLLSGYIEGEALYMSSSTSGAVSAVSVVRGQRVAAGQPLFAIDAAPLIAQRDQAAAALAGAEARLADAGKGQRPQELAVFDAQGAAAEAAVVEARKTLDRAETLVQRGVYPRARLDAARAAWETAVANRRTVSSQRTAGTLGARPDAVRAAEAQVQQARQALAEVQALVDRTGPRAPVAARVEQVFFQAGEWATANQPVVSLMPDDRVRLRFFVPERELSRYRVGRQVAFSCDGCKTGLSARINYVSPRPEFTPPIIYSRDSRDRLVFMIEARPETPGGLNPGQPVDVRPLEAGA